MFVSEKALNWLRTYLYPWNFRVNIGEEYSTPRELTFWVPQGSMNGPNLFCYYSSSLREIVPTTVDLNAFTDDHMLKKSFKPGVNYQELNTIKKPGECLVNTHKWMCQKRLKMNPGKMEFIMYGTWQQLIKCKTKAIKVVDDDIELSEEMEYLGS